MPETYKIFILGPMKPDGTFRQDEPRFVHATHTTRLLQIVEGIFAQWTHTKDPSFEVAAPDQQWGNGIIQNILAQVEDSDLVIVDASGNNGTVMYELGAVHALGIPYIIVTSDPYDDTSFYLKQLRIIPDFNFIDEFDAADATHTDLKLKLEASIDARETGQFSTSAVSDYFQGFPIVNISGPASMASSYHINTVVRFCAQGSGFMARPVNLMAEGWDQPKQTRIRALCIVIPDLFQDANFDAAKLRFEDALNADDLHLESVSILEPKGDDTRFSFGGMVLKEDPSIIIDIPRNMFAMKHVPRVLTARAAAGRGKATQASRRQLARMRRDYRDIILWNLDSALNGVDDGWWDQVYVLDQDDAVSQIKALL